MSIAQRTSLAAAKAARAVRNSRRNLLRRFRLRRCVCALTVISTVYIAAPPQAVFAARVCRAAAFAATYPQLNALNVMHLHSPASAILSAVIFNALIIVFLIPLALKGVSYKPLTSSAMLRRNLWIYGLGGLVVPFIGIKVIDMLLTLFGLV